MPPPSVGVKVLVFSVLTVGMSASAKRTSKFCATAAAALPAASLRLTTTG